MNQISRVCGKTVKMILRLSRLVIYTWNINFLVKCQIFQLTFLPVEIVHEYTTFSSSYFISVLLERYEIHDSKKTLKFLPHQGYWCHVTDSHETS